jgi:hypothetical protein
MANEFKHASVGSELSQTEWEAISVHIADGQVSGDILYYDGTYWKRRPYDVGARVYHNANQSINDSAVTTLAFNSERYDTDTIHDNVTNNSRLTCKTAGKYLICFTISFAVNATGDRSINVMLNGATNLGSNRCKPTAATSTIIMGAAVYSLAVNDYVEIAVWQNSGGALNVESGSAYSPEFMMQRIG